MGDIALLGKNKEEVERMNRAEGSDEKMGLQINKCKTKMMGMNVENNRKEREDKEFEQVKENIYLGTLINSERKERDKKVSRITNAWQAFNKYRNLFRSYVDIALKRKLRIKKSKESFQRKLIKKIRVTQHGWNVARLKYLGRIGKRNSRIREQT